MPDQELRGVIGTIKGELSHLTELEREMAAVGEDDSILLRRSRGSILHDFYNCCERVFKAIALELNGGYEETEQWHRALLHRMTMALCGVRPAVLSAELAADLDDYLSFRHVFRNIYGFELRGDRIMYLSGRLAGVAARFRREIDAFLQLVEDSGERES